jgi:hypothetical protein
MMNLLQIQNGSSSNSLIQTDGMRGMVNFIPKDSFANGVRGLKIEIPEMVGEGNRLGTEGPIRIVSALMLWLIIWKKGLAGTLGAKCLVNEWT